MRVMFGAFKQKKEIKNEKSMQTKFMEIVFYLNIEFFLWIVQTDLIIIMNTTYIII